MIDRWSLFCWHRRKTNFSCIYSKCGRTLCDYNMTYNSQIQIRIRIRIRFEVFVWRYENLTCETETKEIVTIFFLCCRKFYRIILCESVICSLVTSFVSFQNSKFNMFSIIVHLNEYCIIYALAYMLHAPSNAPWAHFVGAAVLLILYYV